MIVFRCFDYWYFRIVFTQAHNSEDKKRRTLLHGNTGVQNTGTQYHHT